MTRDRLDRLAQRAALFDVDHPEGVGLAHLVTGRVRFYAHQARFNAASRFHRVRQGRRRAARHSSEGWVRRLPTTPPAPASPAGRRILYVEDRVPDPHLGRGYPRSHRIASELVQLGHAVTLYPMVTPMTSDEDARAVIPGPVEVVLGGTEDFSPFWRRRACSYDLVIVSRPHNKATVNSVLEATGDHTTVLYDAEALYCRRELAERRLRGQEPPPRYRRKILAREMAVIPPTVGVICVSPSEASFFRECGVTRVHVLGHAVAPSPTPEPCFARQGLLFVGAATPSSPNVDAANWLLREIFPVIQDHLGDQVDLLLAGADLEKYVVAGGKRTVEILGTVEELAPLYGRARAFVAPIRFSAGIPIKVYEAAAHGLPVVATSGLARQLGWRDDHELLTADDAEGLARQCIRLLHDDALWYRLRQNALARIDSDCSPAVFRTTLAGIVGDALEGRLVDRASMPGSAPATAPGAVAPSSGRRRPPDILA